MVVVTPLVGSPVIHLGRSPPTWHKAQPGARGQVSHPRERSGLLKDSNLASGSRVQCCAGSGVVPGLRRMENDRV